MLEISITKNMVGKLSPQLTDLYHDFTEFCISDLEMEGDVSIFLKGKKKINGITTGSFHIQDEIIYARVEDRAPVDVMRTIAHELVHQRQKERGDLYKAMSEGGIPDIGGPIEDEANAVAGQLIKKYVKEKEARYIYEL
jgi:Zn-dependent peptidase ImmA (M78 family)